MTSKIIKVQLSLTIVKTYAATLEVSMTNHYQQFQGQLAISLHKQTLLRNKWMIEKCFTFFFNRNILDS